MFPVHTSLDKITDALSGKSVCLEGFVSEDTGLLWAATETREEEFTANLYAAPTEYHVPESVALRTSESLPRYRWCHKKLWELAGERVRIIGVYDAAERYNGNKGTVYVTEVLPVHAPIRERMGRAS